MENEKEVTEDIEALDNPGTPPEFTGKLVLAMLALVFIYILFLEVNNRFPSWSHS